jgi:hypothetical protein
MDADEKKALADIDEYGCHVIHVPEDEEGPPGAPEVLDAPDALTYIGIQQELRPRWPCVRLSE